MVLIAVAHQPPHSYVGMSTWRRLAQDIPQEVLHDTLPHFQPQHLAQLVRNLAQQRIHPLAARGEEIVAQLAVRRLRGVELPPLKVRFERILHLFQQRGGEEVRHNHAAIARNDGVDLGERGAGGDGDEGGGCWLEHVAF